MKRFTETTKWDDPWFRKLPPEAKLFWDWICCKCDQAGVIEPDFDLAAFQTGSPITSSILGYFAGRIDKLPSGKLHIIKFVHFQYGQLSRSCKPHMPVFAALQRHGLAPNGESLSKGIDRVTESLSKATGKPIEGYLGSLEEEEEEKETVKETVKEQDQEKDRRDPCTEEEAWSYAKNLAVSPPWTQQAVAKWMATRQRDGWQTGGMHPKPITPTTWRHDLRASHTWATTEPRNGRRGKELPESETHYPSQPLPF